MFGQGYQVFIFLSLIAYVLAKVEELSGWYILKCWFSYYYSLDDVVVIHLSEIK